MAIADTIISMQTHTSNAYTMIGYGTDLTGINKNLANLSSTIFEAFLESLRNPDTLFTNLPKITGSGSNITLNDTANAPMRIELGASELTQAGTPTPDSPQDIHTISGSNKVVVRSKQLFNNEDLEIGSIDVNTGANTNTSTSIRTKNYIIVESNTTYAFYRTESTNLKFRYYDKDYNYLSGYGASDLTAGTLTTPNNTKFLRITIDMSNDFNYKLQLQKGSTIPETFTPYSSQEADIDLGNIEYCKISTYEDKFIRTSGKNLFDETYYNNTSLYSGGNRYFTAVKMPNSFKRKFYGNMILKGTSQNLVFGFSTTDQSVSTRMLSGGTITNNVEYDFTNASDVYLVIGNPSEITPATDIPKIFANYTIMISTESEISYEPYGSNEWYIKKNIKKYIVLGTENLNNQSTRTNTFRFTLVTNDKLPNNSNVSQIMCNRGNGVPDYYWNRDEVGVCEIKNPTLASIIFSLPINEVNSYATAQTWFINNETILYYILLTPTYTPITGTLANQLENVYQKMLSYDNQTNISQVNNDLSFELSVSAIENL